MQTETERRFRKTAETFVTGAKTLPQEFFVAPEILAEEQQRIFSKHWILAGHQNQIAGPGDFIVIEVAGESIIVVRDKRNEVRGFYNVCRHRGSRLCEAQAGHLAAIQCPYHAWTYSLDGKLAGAPDMETVPGFDRADYSLAPVKVDLWEGFVFVSLTSDLVRLSDWFAPFGDRFSSWTMSQLRSARRINYDIAANWKLIFQNYSECYHCAGVHPELTKLSPSDSAENDLTEGYLLGGFMTVQAGQSLTRTGNACAIPINDLTTERVFYYSVFPNMLLSLHPEYVMVHRLSPQTPSRTLIVCDWFFHPDAFDKADFNPDDAVQFWDTVNRQDWHVCELSQEGISSRAYQPGPYSGRESIPAAWDREYLRQMGR